MGTLVVLPLTEGAVNALGAEDTLGAQEVEGPNKGAPVGPRRQAISSI